ncbi:MAG: hypothetical protein CM15mP83_5100 [Flavobacteriaceae bacterium]|nr:MAG: hypothetical protein CM15mP83_5100 [Flavobacteriaceae bacterium]
MGGKSLLKGVQNTLSILLEKEELENLKVTANLAVNLSNMGF